jgi:hypothetical protein
MKPPKYRNKPTTVDGIRFASMKEARRWDELKLLERAGEIADLKRQQPFALKVNGRLICTYVADAVFRDVKTGETVIEDVKSPITRKNPTYRIKAKLMAALHGEVREV